MLPNAFLSFDLFGKTFSFHMYGLMIGIGVAPHQGWAEQHPTEIYRNEKGQFGKPKDRGLSYEENCLAQIDEICNPPQPQEDETQQRLSALEEENINLSTTLDDILTNIIPSITGSDSK